ncbi:MAG: HAMP domain-containing histidine kinase [Bacteroidetes bacterium]|nr:HAMP domain-containing histidine kinase [Bacteroidota bacterium]
MMPNRNNLFIAISSLALLCLLIIQLNWIFETASIKEKLFSEKANMVLARTTEALLTDTQTCRQIERSVGENEKHKIDSIFKYYMNFYNFHVDYSFEVIKSTAQKAASNELSSVIPYPGQPACYEKGLVELSKKTGFELRLVLPEKRGFIKAELKSLFIVSILLILVVLFLFYRIILSLKKEKEISEHTTDYLNNMTHEFKTPLTNIALAGKMMVKDANIHSEEKIKHYSEIILEENEKLKLQVDQVLSMTALERGEIRLQKKELDFHQLITDSIKHIGIQVEHKNGTLKLALKAERFRVLCDEIHLTNALSNLIDNAIKYSKANPEIQLNTTNAGHNLQVVISDKGIGIEKEYHNKIFEKFFRVPTGDVHDVKGFGLGLSYIKNILELHQGKIEVESAKGAGTTFTITLPYV